MVVRPSAFPLLVDREELAAKVAGATGGNQRRTFVIDAVAAEFVDRLLASRDAGSYIELLTWIDRTCQAHPTVKELGPLFAGACRIVSEFLGTHGGASLSTVGELQSLEQSIVSIAFKSRVQRTTEDDELSNVDRAIKECLERIEAHDPCALEHAHAVSAWCRRIARRLSLSESEVTYSARAGLIHDIGLTSVSLAIVNAPRKLTDEEWEAIRAHTTLGEEMTAVRRVLRSFSPVVRSHHERLDGRGYPDGLAGSQINLATRIVSVADAFNAMVANRPYRLPKSPSEALQELYDCRGTQFDPIVVEAMIEVVSQSERPLPRGPSLAGRAPRAPVPRHVARAFHSGSGS